MSNKIVPTVYRAIIDDVIANVAVDFEEYGMDDDVLQILQAKWESKLLETRVADFARAPGPSSSSSPEPKASQGGPAAASSPAGPSNHPQPAYGLSFPAPGHGLALPSQSSSSFASPPGQQYNGLSSMGQGNMGHAGQYQGGNMGMMNGGGGYGSEAKPDSDDLLRLRGGAFDDDEKDVKPYIKPEPNAAGLLPGDEVIDSDLDDSDDELRDDGDEDGDGDVDIVFCVYDKVQRVKNKWKTVLKDGMIHINGRDYLFAKCNGEFEW